jgi:hypothetical protein
MRSAMLKPLRPLQREAIDMTLLGILFAFLILYYIQSGDMG